MLSLRIGILVICLVVVGESAFPTTLSKCSMSDNGCLRNLIQTVLSLMGKNGVKELGIPPIDPLQLKNVSVSLLDLLDLSLVEGVVKGVKDCVVDNVTNDIPNDRFSLSLICDITIKGHYTAYSSSPLIKTLLGGDFIRGDGIGKAKVSKINLKMSFMPYVIKNTDGDIFITTNINETKCDFEILGDITVSANNVFLGNEDVSQVITELLNQNAKSLAPYFGKPFMDKTLEFIYSISNKFFELVPAKYYIKEDLSPFVNVFKKI